MREAKRIEQNWIGYQNKITRKKLLENSGIFIDGVQERVKIQEGGFLSMLLETLMLGNMLTGGWVMTPGKGYINMYDISKNV